MALLSAPLKKRVQTFLTDSGAPPRAELTRNYEQICVVMQRRREDDAFWARLTELVRDLVDSVVKSNSPNAPLPPEAKFLALWDINELARVLRVALPHEPDTEPSSGTQRLRNSGGLSPNALGFLLLLSLAASACGGSDSHTGAGNSGTAAGTAATGGASASLTSGGKTGLGGATNIATGGSSHSGGISSLGGNGGTAGTAAGGSAAVGGAALGGTAATGGASASLTTGGRTELGGATSTAAGGSSHTGGTQGLGGDGGTVSTLSGGSGHTGGTQGLGGNGGTVSTLSGGSGHTGGTQGLGGNGGTVSTLTGGSSHTGGTQGLGGNGGTATGGAALTCQRDAGTAAGAPAATTQPLPASCCVDTASALWRAIDDSTLDSTYKRTLYTCFVNLNATWCDGLVDLFKTATPQVIANYLSDLVPCCQALPSMLSVDFATLRQELINRTICNVVLYKGVTFPTELES